MKQKQTDNSKCSWFGVKGKTAYTNQITHKCYIIHIPTVIHALSCHLVHKKNTYMYTVYLQRAKLAKTYVIAWNIVKNCLQTRKHLSNKINKRNFMKNYQELREKYLNTDSYSLKIKFHDFPWPFPWLFQDFYDQRGYINREFVLFLLNKDPNINHGCKDKYNRKFSLEIIFIKRKSDSCSSTTQSNIKHICGTVFCRETIPKCLQISISTDK